MKLRLSLLVLAAIIAVITGAGVLWAQNTDDCRLIDGEMDYERIVEACTQLINGDPSNAQAYFSRGYALTELGELEDAISDYDRYLALVPNDPYAYGNRGYTYYLMQDYDRAIADYTRGLELDDSLTWLLASRAYAYYDSGNYNRVRMDAETLIAQGAPDGYVLLASLDELDEDYQAAILNYSQAIALDPSFPDSYVGRAFNLWMLGEFTEAAHDFYRWLDLTAVETEMLDASVISEPFIVQIDGRNYYLVPLQGGVGVELTATAVAQEETIDPLLVVLDSSGSPIYADDDGAGGISGFDALIDGLPLPSAQGYTLIIGYSGGGSSGAIEVTVEVSQQEIKL